MATGAPDGLAIRFGLGIGLGRVGMPSCSQPAARAAAAVMSSTKRNDGFFMANGSCCFEGYGPAANDLNRGRRISPASAALISL
jgi:hypothetical protein